MQVPSCYGERSMKCALFLFSRVSTIWIW